MCRLARERAVRNLGAINQILHRTFIFQIIQEETDKKFHKEVFRFTHPIHHHPIQVWILRLHHPANCNFMFCSNLKLEAKSLSIRYMV